jgi:glycosyltransferase involved in cell wall biosynthesis
MPCRDAAAHLADAAASIETQTFADFEVLAVDDGSRDGTRAILDAWAARDARVRIVERGESAGIVAALQEAARLARGRFLARMDADDRSHPHRFEKQIQLLDGDGAIAACGTGVRYFPRDDVREGARRYERWINALTSPDAIARDIFVECPIAHPSLMLRRAAFEAAGGYRDMGWPEDYDLVLRLWAGGHALANAADVLLDWRESVHRLSRTNATYDEAAFRRCKTHFLGSTLLRGFERVVVWGAGPVGKAFGRLLQSEGHDLAAWIDLDPRKVGQTVHGAPVIPPASIGRYRDAFVVAAVGSARARAEIRVALAAAGRVEGVDCTAVA